MIYQNQEINDLFDTYTDKLDKSISTLITELASLKAGRANVKLVENIKVDYYGTSTPLSQMANFSIPEARLLVISVWDKSAIQNVVKAIASANIGINPTEDGKVVRLIFPELTEDKRKELCKSVKALGETTKIALRNLRRDINDSVKKLEKDSKISEDELKTYEDEINKILQEKTEEVDKIVKNKEQEILVV